MAVFEQHPYVDSEGIAHDDLVKHESDSGKPIMQLETGRVYEEAVDNYPCAYTYVEIENEQEEKEEDNAGNDTERESLN